VTSPEQMRHFNVLLVECIHVTIVSLLSEQVAKALYERLEKDYSISRDEIPNRLETLLSTLENTFGPSAKIVGKAIAKRFYSKLGLDFPKNSHRTLLDYVEHAKLTLRSRSEPTER
jgi:hypothetical protein